MFKKNNALKPVKNSSPMKRLRAGIEKTRKYLFVKEN
jgi:hypothetical protein